jgi:5-methylthioadenosine/S-adenosylhomocysteine deaminase
MLRARASVWSVLPVVLAIGFAAVEGQGQPQRILIKNASLVLTMDPSLRAGLIGDIKDADVLIMNGKIEAVGQGLSVSAGHDGQVIDARGSIVMPGFIDTQDHYWQSLIRGCAGDDDLNGWLNRCVFPLNGHPFSEQDAYAGVRLTTTGLINTGVTTGVDWSHAFNPDFVRGNLHALNDSGMRYHFAFFGATPDAPTSGRPRGSSSIRIRWAPSRWPRTLRSSSPTI